MRSCVAQWMRGRVGAWAREHETRLTTAGFGRGHAAHRLRPRSSTKEPKNKPRQSMVLLYVASEMSVESTNTARPKKGGSWCMALKAATHAPCTRCGDSPSRPCQPRAIWRAAAWCAQGAGAGTRPQAVLEGGPRSEARSFHASRSQAARRSSSKMVLPRHTTAAASLRHGSRRGEKLLQRCTQPHARLSPAPAPRAARLRIR